MGLFSTRSVSSTRYADVMGTPGQDTVKLADFGLASLLSKSHALTTACGTPGYVSPEILTAPFQNYRVPVLRARRS